MASNRGDGLSEKDWEIRQNVKLFRSLMEEIMDPMQMLTSNAGNALSHILGDHNVEKIKTKQHNEGQVSAAQLLFDILEKCDVRGVWTAFEDLLKLGKYERIERILQGKSTDNDNRHKYIVKNMRPIIYSKLDPVLLLPHLTYLSEEDCERIRKQQRNCGKIVASIMLVDKLLRSKPHGWFKQFMLALHKTGYHGLMDEIDPDSRPSLEKLGDDADMDSIDVKSVYSSDMATGKDIDREEDEEEMEIRYEYAENNLDMPNLSPPKDMKKDMPESLQSSLSSVYNLNVEVSEATGLKEAAAATHQDSASEEEMSLDPAGDITNVLETNSDGEEESGRSDDEIRLRPYQEELVQAGLKGKNCVIVAPTGSGKTVVALKIMKEHFVSGSGRPTGGIKKVVFLVNNVALANQQADACKKSIPERQTQLMSGGNEETVALSHLLPEFDIFVMTAQILLDALKKKDIPSLSQFTLLVFDECHHTFKKHPFNSIMSMYLDQKLQADGGACPLPQIIGLTASMGVGKAKDIRQAKEHIQTLCANLDAAEICTVKDPESVRSLSEFVHVPSEDIVPVEGRKNDHFAEFLQNWMNSIEEKIKSKSSKSSRLEDPPRGKRDSQEYKQWISKMKRSVAIEYDADLRHYCMACIGFVEICNDALMINRDVRTRDALKFLKDKIEQMDSSRFHSIEKELTKDFQENQRKLEQISSHPSSNNPKLEKLKQMIVEAYKEKPDSRGIIFVKTRDLVQALQRWMMETPELEWLSPKKLVGQASEEAGGMTQNQQRDVLFYFKDGRHKILLATSVGEEGLDIQKCNLVIRYDYVTNEIAMVQARGRARAEDSKYISVVTEGLGTDEKEQLNVIREVMMNNAIRELQEDIARNPAFFHQEIRRKQEESKMERDLAGVMRQRRVFALGDFQLRCKKCDQFACFNYDLRRFEETHHAVIAEDFSDHCNVTAHPKPTNHTLAKRGKVWCIKCGYDWGIVALYRNKNFFVIKIDSFVIADFHDRKSTCKKWANVFFEIGNLSQSDNEIVSNVSEKIAASLARCSSK